jgi:hypothetical protein
MQSALTYDNSNWNVADLLPYNTQQGVPITREFLLKLTEVLLEYVRQTNDRNCKVLDFYHPADMRRMLDLDISERPVTLQQLIDDCCLTLKYQVKTGMWYTLTAAPSKLVQIRNSTEPSF